MHRALAVLFAFCFFHLPPLQAYPAPAGLFFQDQPQYQQDDQGSAYENFSTEQLDNLLSPIALYPDPLLAQLFVAATFPDQVEEAARYVRAYGQNGVDDQDWDVSVRAVAHYPTVVGMMADKIDWTTSLGQAYVNQSTDVAASVQHLRHMARTAGNLQSSPQQEVLEQDDYIAINPYQPEYIYVPVYDPAIIYYRRPYYGPGITFGVGFPIGAWLNLDFRWGYGGGWGGVYYTGWRQGGWGNGCWNCGWINRSRGRVNYNNSVYINNRYNNITVNRNVVNRTVNVNNINRYNSVHKNVNYNNVQVNNNRANRVNNANNGRPGDSRRNNGNGRPNGNAGAGNRPGNGPDNNGRPGNARGNNGTNDRPNGNVGPGNRPGNGPDNNGRPGNSRGNNGNSDRPNGNAGPGNRAGNGPGNNGRPNSQPVGNDRPAPANKMIDRNIDRGNPQLDQHRGRDNNDRNIRPPATPQRSTPAAQPAQNRPNTPPQPARGQGQPPQARPAPRSEMTRPTPHTFNPNEGHFDPRASSQRGQNSRQQAAQPRPAPQPKAQNRPAPSPRGGEKRKP